MSRIFFRFSGTNSSTTTNWSFNVGWYVNAAPADLVDPSRVRAIARARRIKALADRPGTPEEGVAAHRALERFMAANSLTLADLS